MPGSRGTLLECEVRELVNDHVLERGVRHVRELQADPEPSCFGIGRPPRSHLLDVELADLHPEDRLPLVEELLDAALQARAGVVARKFAIELLGRLLRHDLGSLRDPAWG